jgi:hypothetical protein
MKYDVVAVDLKTNSVRLMANDKEASDAVAIERMAVMRRGCGVEFFAVVPAGSYKDGDPWNGPHADMPTEPIDEREGSIVRVGNVWYPDGPRGLDS